jgi:hypothetical protein
MARQVCRPLGWPSRPRLLMWRLTTLGAAAYAIRTAQAAGASDWAELERLSERDWQREQLPAALRLLVLEDQRQRSSICWHVFDD